MSDTQKVKVRWVRRNWPAGVVPYLIREGDLPRGQKILVFLPHSDDGRFIGATLSMLNRAEDGRPRNELLIVVVSPGYHSVDAGPLSKEEKSALRWNEALCWGQTLGFHPGQMIAFGAEQTYAQRRCVPEDQRRLDDLIAGERPTMVFVPHLSDIAQHTNATSRTMVLHALTRWIAAGSSGAEHPVFVVEYPTLHVPILPPADKTLIVAFTDPAFPAIKHEANKCHQSLAAKYFDMMGHFVEAIDALTGADAILEARRTCERPAGRISDVSINPVKSRGEHFGITRLRLGKRGAEPLVIEERVRFPLPARVRLQWSGTD